MNKPPPDLVAARTRFIAEKHGDDSWDQGAEFFTLHWAPGAEAVEFGMMVVIDPRMDPEHYRQNLFGVAAHFLTQESAGLAPVVAFALGFEAFGLPVPDDDAPAEVKAEHERRRRERTYHEAPDAIEVYDVLCVDITGSGYQATIRRGEPGVIHEHRFPPPAEDGWPKMSGRFAHLLHTLARAAAYMFHDEPMPDDVVDVLARSMAGGTEAAGGGG